MSELIKWDEIEHQIDEARDLKAIIQMQEQMEAIKILVKQIGGSLKTQNRSSRYRIFLEQKVGERYKQLPDEKSRPKKSGTKSPTKKQIFIKDIDKDKKTLHKWTKESDISKEKILEYENICNKEEKELTSAGLLHFVTMEQKGYMKSIKYKHEDVIVEMAILKERVNRIENHLGIE